MAPGGEEGGKLALEEPVEGSFVALEEGEFGGGGEAGEGGFEADELVGGGGGVDAVVEHFGFDGPEAAKLPIGVGHFLGCSRVSTWSWGW